MSVRILDLPAIMGVSERSLFGYRSGKYPVTAKALRKLEAAEKASGIKKSHQEIPVEKTEEDRIREIAREEIARSRPPSISMGELKERMEASYAWPPAGIDLRLSTEALWEKYSQQSKAATA